MIAAGALAAYAQSGTDGLDYELIDNGTAYSVSKGTVTKGSVVIPAVYNNLPVTAIGEIAFKLTKITGVTIPNSVTVIGQGAFFRCAKLVSVNIGNGITSIGENAFDNCTSLTGLTIGSGVTDIGRWAFQNCASLTSITIPNNVTVIDEGAFNKCAKLANVTFEGNIASGNFNPANTFPGDLRDKYLAGGIGKYTKKGNAWTKS